jgi:cell shape-determining protein MreC
VSEINPRPWKWNNDNDLVDCNGDLVLQCKANDDYMFIAVNSYDSLVAEVERLKQEITSIAKMAAESLRLTQENEQLTDDWGKG